MPRRHAAATLLACGVGWRVSTLNCPGGLRSLLHTYPRVTHDFCTTALSKVVH